MKENLNKLLTSICGIAILMMLLSQVMLNPAGVFNVTIWVAAISFALALATA